MTTAVRLRAPALPSARGELSAALLAWLRDPRGALPRVGEVDPLGEDVQLALYVAYELHYRGFDGVDGECEWDPALLGLRRDLERPFLARVRELVPGDGDLDATIADLLVERLPATGTSAHLEDDGELWQAREYAVHRSLYHLKEGDPQAWVIPRLDGAAKTGLVTMEHDEYGSGVPERMHAHLFAQLMSGLGLDPTYGAYLDVAPATTLAEVNVMSLFGLHRALRGALIGQFALVELTSSPGSARMVRALERLGAGPDVAAFYAEHVEADAVHEQVVRRQVLRPLLAAEPELAADVLFGIQASTALGDRWADGVLAAWRAGRSSLLRPLD